ncbi:MAG: PhzF family phenazine biosynthesis protein [Alphaproteobacteria bacterium]|nr:PhzF family phenazine biosynthesis protein [Alphaproteobacteria bacterium]
MTEYNIYQVDAFANAVFKGNPAAVVPLTEWLPDETLLKIAQENNLSETAYFVAKGDGYELRWFTVLGEIDLCGHATLASSYVIFTYLRHPSDTIHFYTRQVGDLYVRKAGDFLTLDFPARPAPPVDTVPPQLITALNGNVPQEVYMGRDYYVVYKDEDIIRAINPDFEIIATKLGRRVCITAPGTTTDFVSRFFCARDSMPDDPVTGSSHCTLVPYWAKRLNKSEFMAAQLSARGGILKCRLEGQRVLIAGQCAPYLVGKIFI